MSIGPILPPGVAGTSDPTTIKPKVEPATPTTATGDTPDRDADGRQVLDVFERRNDAEQEPPPPKPEVEPEVKAEGGGINFVV